MNNFETSTLGTWKDSTGRTLCAAYVDEDTVRVDRSNGSCDHYSAREWMRLYDTIRDAGFVRAS
jgi:hypothetical protein